MKKVAIVQSNYIPWKGYFDMIRNVDLFIFYDHVQYTKYDWRSRNYIKGPEGVRLLSIPCGQNINRKICEVEPVNSYWQKSHLDSIRQCYKRTPFFRNFIPFLEDIYLGKEWKNLSEFNQHVIQRITYEILKAETVFEDSRKYEINYTKALGVKEILEKCGAEIHLCGPAAKNYLTDEFLKSISAKFVWMNYDDYPQYNQLFPPFEHKISILDLIFNEGYEAVNYMKTFNLEDQPNH
jgi:hypothetical protein